MLNQQKSKKRVQFNLDDNKSYYSQPQIETTMAKQILPTLPLTTINEKPKFPVTTVNEKPKFPVTTVNGNHKS